MHNSNENPPRINRRLLACALGLAVMTIGAQVVQARGVTPLSGKSWFAADAGCFENAWNRLENTCNSTQKWLFDAPIDNSNNWHTVQFWGRGNGISPVTCWAVATDNTGTGGSSAMGQRADALYGPLTMYASSVFVPWAGNLHADCDLPPPQGGTRSGVSSFHYDP